MNDKTTSSDAEFDVMKKDLLKIDKKISAIRYIKPQDPKFLDKLDAYQKSLPKGEDIGAFIDDISSKLNIYIEDKNQFRRANFRPLINEFLESLQSKNMDFRIIENTLYRVGCFEMETQPHNGNIRISFDKNVIMPWKPVESIADIDACFLECTKKIKDQEIPIEQFSTMLHQAYKRIQARQVKERKPNPEFVLLKSLHEEILIELFRFQVKGKKNLNVKFKEIFFPIWAFQYNLERYREHLSEVPEERRLLFETGSQADTEKYGIVLNGLSAKSDYKKFCYIRRR